MDVTWLLHNTPESNRQSAAMNRVQSVARHNGELASVLRDARGITFIDYLKKGQTIKNEYTMA
jgi:hypothetical protein